MKEPERTATMRDYHSTIMANITPEETFIKISQVSKWWSLNSEGNSTSLGDVFIVRFKNGDWYKIRIDELIPGKKIVWDVIDAEQTWHDDRKEWTGTKIIWEISPEQNGSEIAMTHLGLTPERECYEKCRIGWDYLLNQSLYKYTNEGTGIPV